MEETEKLLIDLKKFQKEHYFGKYRGIVKKIDDPDNLGRLKAQVPEVLGEKTFTPWAMPSIPYSGKGEGSFMIPPLEAGVWIEFEAGDIDRPIWSGCWWAKEELPKNYKDEATKPSKKIIRTETGLMVSMDDKSKVISVSDKNGNNIIQIEAENNKIYIKGADKAVIHAEHIELVEDSKHPLVFGDDLKNYLMELVFRFNTHMHPGQVVFGGSPVSPTPPSVNFEYPKEEMFSKKVKTG